MTPLSTNTTVIPDLIRDHFPLPAPRADSVTNLAGRRQPALLVTSAWLRCRNDIYH